MAETFAQIGREEAVRRLFEGSGYAAFEQGLAARGEADGSAVAASRLLLEGTDFSLVYFPLKHLGYKSVVSVTGELYASMARPASLGIVLGISSKLDFEHIERLWGGVVAAAKEHGYGHLSLELVPSRNGLAISLSAVGFRKASTEEARPAPASKDLVCVSGSLGSAYFGQQVLEHRPDELEKYRMMVADYLRPELNPATVAQLEAQGLVPACGLFVTRGLSDAVLRLSRATGLGVKVYADRIPFEGNSFALGKELDIDPVSAAMNGGDDCRLLYAVPLSAYERFRRDFQTFDIIGHLALPEAGTVLVTPDGLEHPVSAQGW